ncbi:MAG: hypothetical protein K6E34_06075 [Lachnospiraceae bacterium]|nr:hypothetical protein [Lachnospiraceae bacterium]
MGIREEDIDRRKMDEYTKFVKENQIPLNEIIYAMELSPELTMREVEFLRKWREDIKAEWPLIKEAFLRGKISSKWEMFGYVFVDMTLYRWFGEGIHSLDDLREFEESERERLKRIAEASKKPVRIMDRNRTS